MIRDTCDALPPSPQQAGGPFAHVRTLARVRTLAHSHARLLARSRSPPRTSNTASHVLPFEPLVSEIVKAPSSGARGRRVRVSRPLFGEHGTAKQRVLLRPRGEEMKTIKR
eukprot:6213568-Pleurochrysis_carterae.AAC.6